MRKCSSARWRFSLPLAKGMRDSLVGGYTRGQFRQDVIAGLTVGIIAIPLGMALAIASGMPPQHGLYTSVVAGLVIALTGGSRFNVSGPTAAFVVMLYPITQTWGPGGLLLATLMAGAMLLLMGLSRMGRLITYIPTPVIFGFTAGIAVVIATLQLRDFAGLSVASLPEHWHEKVSVLLSALPDASTGDLVTGLVTLGVLVLWPRLPFRFPGHLAAVCIGVLVAGLMESSGYSVATIGSRFSYSLDGLLLQGIPPLPPTFLWPWQLPGADGKPLNVDLALLQALFLPALGIALLGAIESLLCAVIADGMSGSRHNSDSELVGQGLGNLIAPFFGGIPATAAIARTAANVRAGAASPLAAVIHALVVLAALLVFAPWLSALPMAALAGLLLMTAWNMCELPHVLRLMRIAPNSDRLLFVVTLVLTVMVDMVMAVTVGVVIGALLFVRKAKHHAQVRELALDSSRFLQGLPGNVSVLKFTGPLFFATVEKTIQRMLMVDPRIDTVILYLDGLTLCDSSAITGLLEAIRTLKKRRIRVILADVEPDSLRVLTKAGLNREPDIDIDPTLAASLERFQPGV